MSSEGQNAELLKQNSLLIATIAKMTDQMHSFQMNLQLMQTRMDKLQDQFLLVNDENQKLELKILQLESQIRKPHQGIDNFVFSD